MLSFVFLCLETEKSFLLFMLLIAFLCLEIEKSFFPREKQKITQEIEKNKTSLFLNREPKQRKTRNNIRN